jgi:hypothetical protein
LISTHQRVSAGFDGGKKMGGLVYSGKFEQTVNEHFSQKNIAETAKKFKEMEKKHGPYSFGQMMKNMVPKPDDYPHWDKNSAEISEPVRKHLTDVIGSNLRSAHPLPMVLKVGENVDHTHDLHVKTFAHDGHVHIGLHMLCPNTTLK